MSNVTPFTGNSTAPVPPERLLEAAKSWGLESCLIIGEEPDGTFRFGGSICNVRDIVYLLTRANWFVQDNEFERTPII